MVGALVLVGGTTAKRFASEGGGGNGNDQHHCTHHDQQSQSRLSFVSFCFVVSVVEVFWIVGIPVGIPVIAVVAGAVPYGGYDKEDSSRDSRDDGRHHGGHHQPLVPALCSRSTTATATAACSADGKSSGDEEGDKGPEYVPVLGGPLKRPQVTQFGAKDDETTDDVHEKFPALETAKFVTIVVVIGFSSIARLASSGTVIILQKDWIVVISDNDTDYLASMST